MEKRESVGRTRECVTFTVILSVLFTFLEVKLKAVELGGKNCHLPFIHTHTHIQADTVPKKRPA